MCPCCFPCARRKLMRPKNDGNRIDGVSKMRRELRRRLCFATRTHSVTRVATQPKARPMVTTALRYCVLSLLCHVGFAQEAKQETCLSVMPDEIRLDFTGRFALAHPLLPARSKRSLACDRRLQTPRCAATTSVD